MRNRYIFRACRRPTCDIDIFGAYCDHEVGTKIPYFAPHCGKSHRIEVLKTVPDGFFPRRAWLIVVPIHVQRGKSVDLHALIVLQPIIITLDAEAADVMSDTCQSFGVEKGRNGTSSFHEGREGSAGEE